MAMAAASAIIDAPVEAVWNVVRDFGKLASWLPGITASHIEDERAGDSVGCVRFVGVGAESCTERLLALDDSRYSLSYAFVRPAFPVRDYVSTIELIPVTDGDRTFARWSGTFEESPEDAGKWVRHIGSEVYAAGLASLRGMLAGARTPEGARRWDGWRPAKVFCSSVINGPVEAVWPHFRDFAALGSFHDGVSEMHMRGGVRADTIGGVREFQLNGGTLHERLTYLSDTDHALRYLIEQSPLPWINYHAGVRLLPVSDGNRSFAVWTADWIAGANDDVALIPEIHTNVFQKAFDTLNARFFSG